ncbi:hypothetical protein HPB49_013416 [Dermacentor silvarum]|uniref:Uncharacterized protein n=1 Tax=Dermacentor silvarum TaxID=543639 RepID=A0ACB8CL42_DERSI|nr:hypothetical protein HPB49_013416 [Dermacentor silvarum]
MSGTSSDASTDASATTIASIAEPHHQHEDSTSRVEHRGNADVRFYLESILPQSDDSVPLTAALELLRKELKWHQLSSTEVLNACFETAGRLNFQVKEGQVVICRGKAPSLPSSAYGEPSTRKPVCTDVSVVQPLPHTLDGEFFPVVVRHIVSPEAIFVNLAGDLGDQLAMLHKVMNLFYSPPGKGGTGGEKIAAQDLVAGALCAYQHVDTSGSGADRDHLFRLSLEDLKKLEDVAVPASNTAVRSCLLKGQTEEGCRNYIKVLLSHNERLFSCGTNAFAPECTWRDINSLVTVREKVDGMGKAPYSPHSNSTMLMTVQGDYYVASPLDFSARDYALYRIMGRERSLRTPIYDHKWLSEPNFVGSFEIGEFVYIFYRESAVEFMNCGKSIS